MSQTIEERAGDLVANEGRFKILTDSVVGGVIVVDTKNGNRTIAGAECRSDAEAHATHPRRPLVRAAGLLLLDWFDVQEQTEVSHDETPAADPGDVGLSLSDVERLDKELADSVLASSAARAYGESVGEATREVIGEHAAIQGMSTYMLANMSGIPSRRVRLLLTGKSPLRLADLVGFATALGTTPTALVVEAEGRVTSTNLANCPPVDNLEGSDPGDSANLPPGITSWDPFTAPYKRWNGAVWDDVTCREYNRQLAEIRASFEAGLSDVQPRINNLSRYANMADSQALTPIVSHTPNTADNVRERRL